MAKAVVSVCKFVGTVSLGLLTGLSYSLGSAALPTLHSLPTSSNASTALTRLRDSTASQRLVLTSLSLFAFSTAFILSPSRARHPYLLWTAIMAAAAAGVEPTIQHGCALWHGSSNKKSPARSSGRAQQSQRSSGDEAVLVTNEGEGSAPTAASTFIGASAANVAGDDASHDDDAYNGEEVRRAVQRQMSVETIRASLYGAGFLMSVVGVWGDRY